jgi:hypothetical protein
MTTKHKRFDWELAGNPYNGILHRRMNYCYLQQYVCLKKEDKRVNTVQFHFSKTELCYLSQDDNYSFGADIGGTSIRGLGYFYHAQHLPCSTFLYEACISI